MLESKLPRRFLPNELISDQPDATGGIPQKETLGLVLTVSSDASESAELSEILTHLNYEPLAAQAGTEALDRMKSNHIDIAIVDFSLSDMTGIELVDFIKTLSEGLTPVIMLSTSARSAELAVALEHGLDSYLLKPVDPTVLQALIRSLLKAAASERDKRELISEVRYYGQRLRNVVESVPGVVWETEGGIDLRTHKINFVSERIETISGFRQDDIRKAVDALTRLVHPEDKQALMEVMARALRTRTTQTIQFRVFGRDGSIIPLETFVAGVFDEHERPVGLRGVSVDISDRRRNEEALLRAKNEAEEASAAKDQFLAVLSHELRTPLTPVITTLDMIEESELSDNNRALLAVFRRNVELEARLIDDLLDLTTIHKGKLALELEVLDADAIIQNVVALCRTDIEAKEINLKLLLNAPHPRVKADPSRLQQIIWNVVHNACKFTPAQGAITISTEIEKNDLGQSEGTLIIQISDTGIGIPSDRLPNVFRPFEQREVLMTQQFGGLGLGMAITQHLVMMHGGTISVNSRGRNLGTAFHISLPLITEARPQLPHSELPAERAVGKTRILFVDDHADTAKVVKLLLERRGYEVERAESLATALAISERFDFDLLLSDIGLPDGSGHELIQAIQDRKGPIRAIAVSGFGTADDISHSLRAGFQAHMTKPFNFTDLHKKIEDVLSEAI